MQYFPSLFLMCWLYKNISQKRQDGTVAVLTFPGLFATMYELLKFFINDWFRVI